MMMDYLCEWMKQIAYYMVFVTLVMNLVAGKEYQKYVRIFTGLILMLLILSPITRMFSFDEKSMLDMMEAEYENMMKEIDTTWDELPTEKQEESEQFGGQGIEVEEIRIGQ